MLHAAGVVDDRLVRDKTTESFGRVLETKINAALELAACLDPSRTRFVAFFSSLSARLGNAGQADYAAANEVLNKLAVEMQRAWSLRLGPGWRGHGVSLAWGPWAGGMMTGPLQAAYVERGVPLIGLEAGARAFVDELCRFSGGEVALACEPKASVRAEA